MSHDEVAVTERAARVRMLVLDVDGVLTDGRIYYSDDGSEMKAFYIRDGLGVKLLQRAGVKVAIITGRDSPMVTRRAGELGIEDVVQGREDKREALLELCQRHGLRFEDCAYMGDDLPDLGAIVAAGLGMTVADGCNAVLESADWISTRAGGCGAVREACEFILSARGDWLSTESGFS
ncbi:MAG: HAD-IIIA family hydrolase [Halioglobus sp.]|nr:HAD-IIIA family hydrolase [Halioglobus sp.]